MSENPEQKFVEPTGEPTGVLEMQESDPEVTLHIDGEPVVFRMSEIANGLPEGVKRFAEEKGATESDLASIAELKADQGELAVLAFTEKGAAKPEVQRTAQAMLIADTLEFAPMPPEEFSQMTAGKGATAPTEAEKAHAAESAGELGFLDKHPTFAKYARVISFGAALAGVGAATSTAHAGGGFDPYKAYDKHQQRQIGINMQNEAMNIGAAVARQILFGNQQPNPQNMPPQQYPGYPGVGYPQQPGVVIGVPGYPPQPGVGIPGGVMSQERINLVQQISGKESEYNNNLIQMERIKAEAVQVQARMATTVPGSQENLNYQSHLAGLENSYRQTHINAQRALNELQQLRAKLAGTR
jgi:hypothetical protein